MKRIARLLSVLLVLCTVITMTPVQAFAQSGVAATEQISEEIKADLAEELGDALDTEDYTIEVETYYVSKEYLEEIAFLYRQTNWFGYYLTDVDVAMEGQKWVFTTIDGETTVKVFEPYDDTYDIALRNVAIGAGVIVVCVTVSVATGGIAPAVSAIFAVSAKTAAIYGVSSGAISGVISGVATAYKTDGDMDAALAAAAQVGSSSFMWGAISGAALGGISEAVAIHGATASGLTMNEVAALQKQTGWSYETISSIKSVEEAAIYQNAGLKEIVIGGRTVLARDIDMAYKVTLQDGRVYSNMELVQMGYAPYEPATGLPYQLHHVNQDPNGVLAMLSAAEHQPNASILNTTGKPGAQAVLGSAWSKQRKEIWMAFAQYLEA